MENNQTQLRPFTRNETAKILGVSPERITELIVAGKLQAIKIGRRYRITEDAIRKSTSGQ